MENYFFIHCFLKPRNLSSLLSWPERCVLKCYMKNNQSVCISASGTLLGQLKKQAGNKWGLGKKRILCSPVLPFSLPDAIYCLFAAFTTFPTEQEPGTG